jgi:hypothetical protein
MFNNACVLVGNHCGWTRVALLLVRLPIRDLFDQGRYNTSSLSQTHKMIKVASPDYCYTIFHVRSVRPPPLIIFGRRLSKRVVGPCSIYIYIRMVTCRVLSPFLFVDAVYYSDELLISRWIAMHDWNLAGRPAGSPSDRLSVVAFAVSHCCPIKVLQARSLAYLVGISFVWSR